MNNIDIPNTKWYADTRATAHMTSNPGNLLSSSSYNGSEKKFVGDYESLSISHAGDTILPSSP